MRKLKGKKKLRKVTWKKISVGLERISKKQAAIVIHTPNQPAIRKLHSATKSANGCASGQDSWFKKKGLSDRKTELRANLKT